ncbi:unnamed protein product, partial [Rangifer tarandus platyrhynchus]
ALKTVSAMAAWGQAEGPRSGLGPGAREALPTPLILSSLGSTPLQGQEEHRQQQRGFPAFPATRHRQDPTSGPRPCPEVGWTPQEGAPVRVPPASP